jgi:hypothetical protein
MIQASVYYQVGFPGPSQGGPSVGEDMIVKLGITLLSTDYQLQ